MRPVVIGGCAALLLFLSGCTSDGDERADRTAEPTFRDGLTAEDILDRAREANEETPATARVRTTETSSFGGRQDRDVTEMILVGEDLYMAHYDGDEPASEFLYYEGEFYTREEPGDVWTARPEFRAFGDVLQSAKAQLSESIDPESVEESEGKISRLADEVVGDRKSYQVSVSIEGLEVDPRAYLETVTRGIEEQSGKEIPTVPAGYIPDRMSYEIRFWYSVDDYTMTRYQMRASASQDGEEKEMLRKTMEVLDKDRPLTLPGPLPEN